MKTRRTLAFVLALIPVSRLVAQEAVPVSPDSAAVVQKVAGDDLNTARTTPPVLYPLPVPYEVIYANCDGSRSIPMVNVLDLVCFINHVAAGSEYANCDGSEVKPYITANDFLCYMNAYSTATQWEYHQTLIDP